MKKLMTTVALAAIACGCITVNKNDGGNSCIKQGTIKDKVHLKYELGNDRVQAADQLNCLFGFICWGSTATHNADQGECGFGADAKVKNGAYANACDAAKCDQIAGARYTITTDDYFSSRRSARRSPAIRSRSSARRSSTASSARFRPTCRRPRRLASCRSNRLPRHAA